MVVATLVEARKMRKSATFACLCAPCLLGGCLTVEQFLPPIRGSVADAATGAPIESAKVTIDAFGSERACLTDCNGHYRFKAKYYAYFWLPVPYDRFWHFELRAQADGYAPSDAMPYHGGPAGFDPPPGTTYPNQPKMTYDGKVMSIDPIPLSRVHPKGNEKR